MAAVLKMKQWSQLMTGATETSWDGNNAGWGSSWQWKCCLNGGFYAEIVVVDQNQGICIWILKHIVPRVESETVRKGCGFGFGGRTRARV